MTDSLKPTRKLQNKEKVIQIALEFFCDQGIENSKVSDIAVQAGLTERTVFRYFATKSDLVLASALYFWENAQANIRAQMEKNLQGALNGIDKVRFILNQYASLYESSKKELIFCDCAETYLNRSDRLVLLSHRPPVDFCQSTDPLAKAIKEGLVDGSIPPNKNIGLIYLNTYDGLLGFMQKLALSEENNRLAENKIRLELYVESLIKMYQ